MDDGLSLEQIFYVYILCYWRHADQYVFVSAIHIALMTTDQPVKFAMKGKH